MLKTAPWRLGRALGLAASLGIGGLLLSVPLIQPAPAHAAFDDGNEWGKRAAERARERHKREAEQEREWHKREAEREREWHKREAEREREAHKRAAEHEREWHKHRSERQRDRWKNHGNDRYTHSRSRRPGVHPDLDRDGVPNTRDRYPRDQRRH